ncbi:MAG TPA: DUF418 domain-containing protein [Vicinamibacterales bacterium]|nr:DUF418 domain-containing protein [Vicinamibacterales bacterium]
MPQPAPVAARDRLESLDVLRGAALLGILAMNIRGMAAPLSAYMYPYALFDHAGASRAAYLFTSVVFDLKMMGLFSMLFGASVLLYADKPTERGRPPRGLWFRRMFWLLVIGLVHAYLVWGGDILVPYALCGILLLWWVRRLPAWLLAAGAFGLLAVGALLTFGHGMAWENMSAAERAEEAELMMPSAAQAREQLSHMFGSYPEIVAHHAPLVLMFQTLYFGVFFFWRCGGMMLLGMALYKWGFLDGSRSERAYAVVAVLCITGGLAQAAYGSAELERVRYALPERTVIDLWNYVGAVFASVGYAAVIMLIVKRGVFPRFRTALAAVGQMALSNYLLQSVITSSLFLGWGVGLAGRLDYAGQLVIVASIWAVQLIASPLWLRRYRFGPAEWFWRSLTYWRRQPMRRDISLTPRYSGTP